MNTHLIVLDDIMLCAGIPQGCLFPFPVAASAEFRDIAGKYGGFVIGLGHYIMGTMAVGTDRGIFVILCGVDSMGAFIIEVYNLGMADGTIDLAGVLADRVILVIHIDMALGTGNPLFLVDRMLKILDIDIKALLFAVGHYLFQVLIGMASQAELVIKAVLIKNPPGLVRPMAFDTGWHFMWFGFPQFTANNLGVRLFNIGMTLHTGLDHILAADGGVRVRVGQDIVGRMAAGADRGHGQPFAVKAFSVDGHGKILQNIFFGNIMG
jgi:hypothetical protein